MPVLSQGDGGWVKDIKGKEERLQEDEKANVCWPIQKE